MSLYINSFVVIEFQKNVQKCNGIFFFYFDVLITTTCAAKNINVWQSTESMFL